MKRLLATLTIVCSLISLSSFANPENVTPRVLESFNSSFKQAKEVDWSVGENFYKATFLFNGQYVSAFYNEGGSLLALTRNISSAQLPLTLQTNLKANYQDYWISDLFEIADTNGTSYYVTIENSESKLVLQSSGSDWTTFQKQRKL